MAQREMSKELCWLTEQLPPTEPIVLRSEPDYYGASYEIARQLGKASPPRSFATWRHGWVYQPLRHPRQLVPEGGAGERHLVATEAHADALRRFGFPRAVAVGLPFIYAPPAEIARQPDSLLVMPSHSLPYTDHAWDEARYVAEIARLKPHFAHIVACVHSACVAKGLWVSAFERHDIPWVVGAMVEDRNALRRMSMLFSAFEAMTTNTMGSHIAYAAYSGCRVSIYGPYASVSAKEHERTPLYVRHPDLLEIVVEEGQEAVVRQQYPEFFVPPTEAIKRKAWAAEVLGLHHKQPARKIADLLGWSLPAQIQGHSKRALNYLHRKVAALMIREQEK